MNRMKILKYLLELTRMSAQELINIYDNCINRNRNQIDTSIKIISEKGKSRISEQEFRFVMAILHSKPHININGYTQSIETPTSRKDYSFSGRKPQNAWSDLSFFDNDKCILNIEFKAHNPSPQNINKDIEKLCKEPTLGAWCHIFKNERENTVETLFNKFIKALEWGKYRDSKTKSIAFHILILGSRTLLSRNILDDDLRDKKLDLKSMFNIQNSFWKDLEPGRYQKNGWEIKKY